jgi:endonuclease/exonuclease/phosphatase (EEP) superfamily protein YafD
VRNDSFDIDNNLVQVKAILRKLGRREALLAGDFNAPATSAPMKLLRESGRFSGAFDGPPTFPADEPAETIDFVLAPRSWTLLEHHVPRGGPSDHRAVVSTFRMPAS